MATKYQPLVDHVAAQTKDTVTLSFTEIEALVGALLPETMQIDTGWWNGVSHAYVRAWQAAGWTATLDRRNRRVLFTRAAEE